LRRGRFTIPVEFRRRLGIRDDTLLQLTLHEDRIEVQPVAATAVARMAWVQELYALFAPVRQEARAMSEAEIDAAIDEAVCETVEQASGPRELRSGHKWLSGLHHAAAER
jgi:bifunctional DNA-binding transcriptional regulator/antitoxin component of YhaV-PrlF toxin-antitoxin module